MGHPFPESERWHNVRIAHIVICGISFLLFATGGILIRILGWKDVINLHATIQLFAATLFIAGSGMGIWLGNQDSGVSVSHTRRLLTDDSPVLLAT
jgi:hypothetical protein